MKHDCSKTSLLIVPLLITFKTNNVSEAPQLLLFFLYLELRFGRVYPSSLKMLPLFNTLPLLQFTQHINYKTGSKAFRAPLKQSKAKHHTSTPHQNINGKHFPSKENNHKLRLCSLQSIPYTRLSLPYTQANRKLFKKHYSRDYSQFININYSFPTTLHYSINRVWETTCKVSQGYVINSLAMASDLG